MEIIDIAAIAASNPGAAAKLITTIGKITTLLIGPAVKRVNGLADAANVVSMAKAEAEAKVVAARSDATVAEIVQQAEFARVARELRHQLNIIQIAEQATRFLPEKVSPEPVDPDWINEFFDDFKNVSDATVQLLLAKVLAGEVAQPRSISRRALMTLRQMGQADAELLTDVGSGVWSVEPEQKLVVPSEWLSEESVLHAQELGILTDPVPHYNATSLVFSGRLHRLEGVGMMQLKYHHLTRVGAELIAVARAEPDMKRYEWWISDQASRHRIAATRD